MGHADRHLDINSLSLGFRNAYRCQSSPTHFICRKCGARNGQTKSLSELLSNARISASHSQYPCIRPSPDRVMGLAVPGTTDTADEMVRHIRHRQPLRQSERQWLDIEVTGWPAGRAFDLKEFSIPGEIAECYGHAPGADEPGEGASVIVARRCSRTSRF